MFTIRPASTRMLAVGCGRSRSLGSTGGAVRPLLVIDLHVMPRVREQKQLGAREEGVESLRHTGVQVGVGGTEDDPHRARERAHLGEPPPPRDRRAEQVGVEGEERGAFGSELFVQLADDLPPVAGVGDEAAHLPRVQAPIERVRMDDQPASQGADEGQREEQDGLGRAQARHPSVVGVQQHQCGYPLRVVERPVDR
ncbi:MAG TPA: hypothetical protein VE777_03955, partial [Gaiellales bacterium]|nr:hypothetical protein [Gaiellales bacterium]